MIWRKRSTNNQDGRKEAEISFSQTSATIWRSFVYFGRKIQFYMADNDRGQSLITKYVWVIETIYRRRKISFKELNELWLRNDISKGVDIPKRTFDNWRYVIWDMFGISIVNENRGEYRYYIENEEDGRCRSLCVDSKRNIIILKL